MDQNQEYIGKKRPGHFNEDTKWHYRFQRNILGPILNRLYCVTTQIQYVVDNDESPTHKKIQCLLLSTL